MEEGIIVEMSSSVFGAGDMATQLHLVKERIERTAVLSVGNQDTRSWISVRRK